MRNKNLPAAIACAVAGIVATQFIQSVNKEQSASSEIIALQDADPVQLTGLRTRLITVKDKPTDPPTPPTKTLTEATNLPDF